MKKIAVFASGGGTDFQSVIDANDKEPFCEIACLVASKDGIGAMERARLHKIPAVVYKKADFSGLETLYEDLRGYLESLGVDYIVLAGWIKIIPASFIERYKNRIINIHPSLIPSFCGAGFYGMRVHEAVLDYGAKVSGCTVHFVDDVPDGGAIIAQEVVSVRDDDTPESLQQRILVKEHELLPRCVKALCEGRIKVEGRKVTITEG